MIGPETREARPDRTLTTQNNIREQQGWYDRPHSQLVDALKAFVQQRHQRFGGHFSPEEILRSKLKWQADTSNSKERDFFQPLLNSWDALVYDRYEPGSQEERVAGSSLHYYSSCDDGGPSIKLSDPLQIKIIDALADVAQIPHQKGQAEIAIPKKIREYDKWIFSKEYQDRVARAKAKK